LIRVSGAGVPLKELNLALLDAYRAASAAEIKVGGRPVEYFSYPATSGYPTIVLLPGLFSGGWIWGETYSFLAARGYGVIAVNNAFARIRADRENPFTGFNAMIDALIAGLPPDQVILCGNSMGSLAAIEYAVANPTKPLRVIGSGVPGLDDTMPPGLVVHRAPTPEDVQRLVDGMFYDPSIVTQDMIDDALVCFSTRAYMANTLSCLVAVKICPVQEHAAALGNRLTLIWGREDRLAPFTSWEAAFAPEVAAGTMRKPLAVDQAGHCPMIERPDEFNAVLGAALKTA
jgi:2-hydroxy-6-oxonona-2,4-dienedioate hydrolase